MQNKTVEVEQKAAPKFRKSSVKIETITDNFETLDELIEFLKSVSNRVINFTYEPHGPVDGLVCVAQLRCD